LQVTAYGLTQPPVQTSCTPVVSVTIVAPSAGTVVADALVRMRVNHVNGLTDTLSFVISDAPASCFASQSAEVSGWTLPGVMPTASLYDSEIPVRGQFAVTAGSHTYELGGFAAAAGQDNNDQVLASQMHAVFYPG
ncbi:MAG: hypothetical protein JWM73_338, partial [Solirubrobacterales bacterium]|nr:hypothetical protein [Solirubrobacterales bacterium]